MNKQCQTLVDEIRQAVQQPNPTTAVKALLRQACDNPAGYLSALNEEEATERLLFEDASCSVWVCRFSHRKVLPAHEHGMTVHLAVLTGVEENLLFQKREEGLVLAEVKTLTPGDILSLGPEGIHGVTAAGDRPCVSLHVYLGPLTEVSRRVFDWQGGSEEVSDAAFTALTLDKSQLQLKKGAFLTELPLS